MATLPSDLTLGQLPAYSPAGTVAQYDSQAVARGGERLGQGITQGAQYLKAGLEDAKTKRDAMETARAGASYLTGKVNLDGERDDLTDASEFDAHKPKYNQNLAAASQMISDPAARERFMLGRQPDVAGSLIATKNAAFKSEQDQGLAADNTTLDTLYKTGIKARTPAEQDSVIHTAHDIIDAQEANGYITAVEAQKRRLGWAQSYSDASLRAMPAAQRLAAIGENANPADVAAKFAGLGEGNHPEVLTEFFKKTGGAAIDPRETPWCAAQADAVLFASGYEKANTLRAADFLKYGTPTDAPSKGDIVVFKPQVAGSSGHVGFVIGVEGDKVRYIAGNDSNKVQENTMGLDQVAGFRIPQKAGTTPIMGGAGPVAAGQKIADAVAADNRPSKLASILPPDHLAKLGDAARIEINQTSAAQDQAVAGEKIAVSRGIDDDRKSIMASGQPVETMTPDRVGAALGPIARDEFIRNRADAQNYYLHTKDMERLPDDQIRARVQALTPKFGVTGVGNQEQYQKVASGKANAIIKQRETFADAAAADEKVVTDKAAADEKAVTDKAAANERTTVQQAMKDDEKSLYETGQPIKELTPQRVEAALGPAARDAFLRNRANASRYYSQTSNLENVPNDQIRSRMQALAPESGTIGFGDQGQYQEAASKRADAILKQRAQDPAASVSENPQVKELAAKTNWSDPVSVSNLGKARMAAQEAIGIPEASRTPIMRNEAMIIAAPLTKALPGEEKAGMVRVLTYLDKAFGPNADKALNTILETQNVEAGLQEQTVKMMRTISAGNSPEADQQRNFQHAAEIAAAERAVALKPAAQGKPGIPVFDPATGRVTANNTGPVQGQYVGPQAPAGLGAVPFAAQTALMKNPDLAAQFDAKYGAGISDYILRDFNRKLETRREAGRVGGAPQ